MSTLRHEAANEALAWAPFDQGGDLLGDEREALAQHVDGCEPCQDDEAALARFLGAWERVVGEDRGADPSPNLALVWERVQGELLSKGEGSFAKGSFSKDSFSKEWDAAPGPESRDASSSAPGGGIEVRRVGSERSPSTCAFCHGYLAQRGRVLCRSCGAPHHLGCFRAHGRCSTMGCEQTRFQRPTLVTDERPALEPAEWRLSLAIRTLAMAASLLICLSAGALAWQAASRAIDDDQTQRGLAALDVGISRINAGFSNVRANLGEQSERDPIEPEEQKRHEKIADARNLVLRRTLIEVSRRTEVVATALVYGRQDGTHSMLMARVGQGAPSGVTFVKQRSLHEVSLPDGSFARADVGRLSDYRYYLTPSSVLRVQAPLREADQVLEEGRVELWVFLDRGSAILAKERSFHLVAFLTLAACCLVLGLFSWWCVRQRARVRRAGGR